MCGDVRVNMDAMKSWQWKDEAKLPSAITACPSCNGGRVRIAVGEGETREGDCIFCNGSGVRAVN